MLSTRIGRKYQTRAAKVAFAIVCLLFVDQLINLQFRSGSQYYVASDCDKCLGASSAPPVISCNSCFPKVGEPLIVNPKTCALSKRYGVSGVLVVVLSKFSNLDHRNAIRETWGQRGSNDLDHFLLLFILGRETVQENNQKIKEESDAHGDIFQTGVQEDYRTVTKKLVSAFRWISENCRHFDYVVKVDDDVYLNRAKLNDHLLNQQNTADISCPLCQYCKPIRDASSKWFVPYDQYPYDYYPDYCFGPFYAMSFSNLNQIVTNLENVPYFDIEDVFLTGLVAHKAQLHREHLPSVVNIKKDFNQDIVLFSPCLFKNHVVASHGNSPCHLRRVWQQVREASCPTPGDLPDKEAIARFGHCRFFCWIGFITQPRDTC